MTIAPDSHNPMVSLIIVSYNHLEVLIKTLEDLRSNFSDLSKEIILVDNASQEPVVETIRNEFPEAKVFTNAQNIGFGAANNIGASEAKGEFLLFMNSDLLISGNPIKGMIQLFQQDENIGIVGCQLWNRDGTPQPSFFRFPSLTMRALQLTGLKNILLKLIPAVRFSHYGTQTAGFVSGAFFMIRRSLFQQIGGFDERYFMYIEDADLGYQAAQQGKKSVLFPSKDIIHLGVNYEEENNTFVLYNMNRGLALFYKKNYSLMKYITLATMSTAAYLMRIFFAIFKTNRHMLQKTYIDLIRFYWITLFH